MIKYVKGNLLDAFANGDVNIIAHQCNCFNTMASGIAPQIARRWPTVREADDATLPGDKSKLGTFTNAWIEDGVVFNLYGQFYYGRSKTGDTDYVALGTALNAMRKWIDNHYIADIPLIGFPKIGCGLGGGDWLVVSAMIEVVFDGMSVVIYEL